MSLQVSGGGSAVLIIEGIHALNPHYTSKIQATEKFGTYDKRALEPHKSAR